MKLTSSALPRISELGTPPNQAIEHIEVVGAEIWNVAIIPTRFRKFAPASMGTFDLRERSTPRDKITTFNVMKHAFRGIQAKHALLRQTGN